MAIVDCCLYSGEVDHLLIRLTELEDVVDQFVVVQSEVTFQGHPRDCTFPDLGDPRFTPWEGRIRHLVVSDPCPGLGRGGVNTKGFMLRERATRDSMVSGYSHMPPDTVVLISDVDEIPTVEGVLEARDRLMQTERCVVFKQEMYVWDRVHKWPGPSWNTCAYLAGYGVTPQESRDMRGSMIERGNIIHNGGWHLSWQGGLEAVRRKLASFSHAEHLDKMDSLQAFMQESIDINGTPLMWVDVESEPWPRYFIDNPDLWL